MIYLAFKQPDEDDDPSDFYYDTNISKFVLSAFDDLISAKNYIENLFVEKGTGDWIKERLFSWEQTGQTHMFVVEYTFKNAKRHPMKSMEYFIKAIKVKYNG